MVVWIEMAGARIAAVFLRLPLSWRGAGALVVGVLLARWTWVLLGPHTLTVFPAKPEFVEASAALFGLPSPASTPVSTGVGEVSAPHLVGVFSGKRGFAILRLDEKRQVGVVLGEEVHKGNKLVEVAADYVLLERNGTRQRVNLEGKVTGNTGDNKGRANTPPITPVASSVNGAATDPEKLAQKMRNMLDIAKSMNEESQ